MAKNHPYSGGSGAIIQAVNHLRRSFPAVVTAYTLKKLGITPKNESYLINILRFLSIIDAEGKKTETAAKVFDQHDDAQFQAAFGDMVKDAYGDLFALHSDAAWALDENALLTFFRQADQSSGIVGGRQASTFRTLAALSGHGEASTPRPRGTSAGGTSGAKKAAKPLKPAPSGKKTPSNGIGAVTASDPFFIRIRAYCSR